MKYNKIEIIENTDRDTIRKFLIVSDKMLKELDEVWSVCGGFLRFEIDIYTENEKKENKTDKKEIEALVKSILTPH